MTAREVYGLVQPAACGIPSLVRKGQKYPYLTATHFDQVYVTAIQEDQQGAFWVGTGDDGIRRVDLSTGMITRYKHDPQDPHSLSNSYISSLLVDAAGRLWVGTSDGLNLYDPSTEGFFHYKNDPDDLHSLSSDLVFDPYQDRSGVIWIATLAGINKLNETASRFTHYRQLVDPTDAGGQQFLPGLSDSMAEVVFLDRGRR